MHINLLDYTYKWFIIYASPEAPVRTTLILPDSLVAEALRLTQARTKTALIVEALENLVQREKIRGLKSYRGRVKIDADTDIPRKR